MKTAKYVFSYISNHIVRAKNNLLNQVKKEIYGKTQQTKLIHLSTLTIAEF